MHQCAKFEPNQSRNNAVFSAYAHMHPPLSNHFSYLISVYFCLARVNLKFTYLFQPYLDSIACNILLINLYVNKFIC